MIRLIAVEHVQGQRLSEARRPRLPPTLLGGDSIHPIVDEARIPQGSGRIVIARHEPGVLAVGQPHTVHRGFRSQSGIERMRVGLEAWIGEIQHHKFGHRDLPWAAWHDGAVLASRPSSELCSG